MAVAYGAVLSVMHLMEHIKSYHSRHPIFLENQLVQLNSLQEKVCFLQSFLEDYSHRGREELMDDLESQIVDAAYATEDIIESHILDDIRVRCQTQKKNLVESLQERFLFLQKKLEGYFYGYNNEVDHTLVESTSHGENSSMIFSQNLQKLIDAMEFIMTSAVMIAYENRFDDHQPKYLAPVGPPRPPFPRKDTMVEIDEDMYQIMDKLTRQQSSLQIVSITGMGGIGKTTLAKSVYENPLIVQYFDIRRWITVTQEYNVQKMLIGLLSETEGPTNEKEQESSEYHQFGNNLHKYLCGRRYLLVMDDIWNIEAWDKVKLFFPDNDNGSRIMITTRLLCVANYFGDNGLYKMNLLDQDKSWNLLCRNVFIQESCPPEFQKIGKKIARNCEGLPLSLVVIGGLLAKYKAILEYWEYVAENTSMTINSEDDERCLRILSLSYNNLPIHLKPCFLYMGHFPEDYKVRVSELIKLWVSERFIKPHRGKSLEEVAEDYLKDLIDRNLLFVSEFSRIRNMRSCKIHDLLRDFILRKAQGERLFGVSEMHSSSSSQRLNNHRRIVIHPSMSHTKDPPLVSNPTIGIHSSMSYTKDPPLVSNPTIDIHSSMSHTKDPPRVPNTSLLSPFDHSIIESKFRLLRVFKMIDCNFLGDLFQQLNLRYLSAHVRNNFFRIPSSIYLIWNLQVLILEGSKLRVSAPFEIWEMPELRHLLINQVSLPDPPSGRSDDKDDYILKNLQTLSRVNNFRCSEEVVKRIPNIKKLKINYSSSQVDKCFSHYYLNNLGRLHRLQSLNCLFFNEYWPTRSDLLLHLEFPPSIKSLTLELCHLHWEDMTTKIGLLPNLEKLKLLTSFRGETWNPVEGQFLRLKLLQIQFSFDLVEWTADSSHFPSLEHLVLVHMEALEEIPSGIGDIATLRLIQLFDCNEAVVNSVRNIIEEQKSFGNEGIGYVVWNLSGENEEYHYKLNRLKKREKID